MYWRLPIDKILQELDKSLEIENTIGGVEDDDVCHVDIVNLSDTECRRIRKLIKIEDCFICDSSGSFRASQDVALKYCESWPSNPARQQN